MSHPVNFDGSIDLGLVTLVNITKGGSCNIFQWMLKEKTNIKYITYVKYGDTQLLPSQVPVGRVAHFNWNPSPCTIPLDPISKVGARPLLRISYSHWSVNLNGEQCRVWTKAYTRGKRSHITGVLDVHPRYSWSGHATSIRCLWDIYILSFLNITINKNRDNSQIKHHPREKYLFFQKIKYRSDEAWSYIVGGQNDDASDRWLVGLWEPQRWDLISVWKQNKTWGYAFSWEVSEQLENHLIMLDFYNIKFKKKIY